MNCLVLMMRIDMKPLLMPCFDCSQWPVPLTASFYVY